jgi:hypothetical protein
MKGTEIIGGVSITDVFVGLGGDQPEHGRARAFWREGDMGKDLSALSSSLYTEYKQWAATSGEEHVMPQKDFGPKLADREGVVGEHTRRGTVYSGIALAPPNDAGEEAW